MKKTFSFLFTLVLVMSFSLVAAVPAMADGPPTTTLTLPDNVYRPADFVTSSTTTNGETPYTNVRFNITLSGPESFAAYERADVFTITKVNGSEDTQGINDTFVHDGENFAGYWGPAGGFEMPASYTATSTFTVQMCDVTTAPLGDYDLTVELVDLTPEPDVILATATDSFTLSADTLYVGTTEYQHQFTTIQNAIDAASPGDTIMVAAGTYHEYTGTPGAGVAVDVPFFAEGAGGLTIQSSDGAATTTIDCGWAAWGVQMVSNEITFSGFTVKNAYSLINQVSGKNHALSNLIITDFVNYGLGIYAAHNCEFSNIIINTNDVSNCADRTVKGIDIQEYGSGGNTNNTFQDITIYDIETTGDYGTSMGIFFEGDNPGTHPTTGNTFTNVEIYNLTSAYFNCGAYILDGSFDGTGHINPYAIENTTFTGGSIHDFTENGTGVVSRGFYVKGGNNNLDVTGFDITGCDEGVYFKSFDWVQPPAFPPTGWVNNDSWVASTGGTWVSPRTGTYAAGIEISDYSPPTLDDYLIMPQQSISSGDTVSFYAHGTHMFGDVHFELMVSTTGTDPGDFTDTLGPYLAPTAFDSWLAVSEDLSAYDGQSIYIAIYAYESVSGPPGDELLVDDVTLPDASTQGFEGAPTTVGAVDVTINYNDIYENTTYGIDNSDGTGTLDATYNWWGSPSGPYHETLNPGGTGDAVSDYVDFEPWLVEVPTVTTQAATGVGTSSATLNMDYTVGDYSPVQVRFAWKKAADTTWTETSWVSKSASGNHAVTLAGLDSGTLHDFKAQLEYDTTVIEGAKLQFTTDTPPLPPPSPCFIATAAYGTPTAVQIDVLREFRDVVLLESAAGSRFVTWYYQTSPPIAEFIAGNELLRTLVRELLVDPVVWLVESTGAAWRN